MNSQQLLQQIRGEILAGAKGNCECEKCQRDRRWLKLIDEVQPDTCEWKSWEDGGRFDTQCDDVFEFTNDGIKENKFTHCPFCGRRIVEVERQQAE